MPRLRLLRPLSMSTLVLVAACVSAGSGGEQPAPVERCEGRAVLMVRNSTGGDIELHESRNGARTLIAVLGPGVHEIDIRNESGYSYVARPIYDEDAYAATSRPRARDRRNVAMSRECREL